MFVQLRSKKLLIVITLNLKRDISSDQGMLHTQFTSRSPKPEIY